MDKELTLAEKMARKKAALESKSQDVDTSKSLDELLDEAEKEVKTPPKKGKGKPKPKPEPEVTCLGRIPPSPEEMNKIIRHKWNVPISATSRTLDIYWVGDVDEKNFLKRYARSKAEFELYYELLLKEMKM